MAVEEILTMSQRELKRLHVIRKAIEKGITQQGAAEVLEISQRQIRRIIKRVRIEADKGVIHRSRGKVSHRATIGVVKNKILRLCRGVYSGFNPTFASEKLFKTFQDRLVKEMRLRSIKNIPEANKFLRKYLPIFNKRFSVAPLQSEDLHRQLPPGVDLDKIFSVRTPRVLRNDFTVVHEKKLYQIEDAIRADKVIVEERLNGAFLITHKGRVLQYRQIAQRPIKEKRQIEAPKAPIQLKDNPWRHFRLPGSNPTKAREEVFAGAL